MGGKIGKRAVHALTAFLLSAGTVLPILGILDLSSLFPKAMMLSAAIIIVLELLSLHRIAVFSGCFGLAISAAIWLFGTGGIRTVSDFMIAVTLRIRGIDTAIPLIAEEASAIITVILTICSFLACLRKASSLPALILCTGAVTLVWITDRTDMIPWLLPAFAATLTILMASQSEETRIHRILPWAAFITAAAFLIASAGSPMQPLKDKADEMRQSMMDRMFFTEARDVFSLYAAGYSPQGPDQLGGKPHPDEQPVMQVSTPKIAYLRGAIYDQYTGRAWKNTAGGRRLLWQSARLETERAGLFDLYLPPEEIQSELNTTETISVRMLKDSTSTLFVPQRIRELIPGGDMVPYFSNSSEVYITRNLQAGDTYTVEAPLYTSGDPGIGMLLEACSKAAEPSNDNLSSIYRQLPDHLEKPLFDLAGEITAGAATPYDKAMAIQNWLNRHYRYTTDVGEHPSNIDFVTSFLFETQKGYCTYFASAMTILCRMAGLPARYVEGYIAIPNEKGEALVTGKEAHAWTEVYFQGFGWLTFDPTPRQIQPNQPEPDNKSPEENRTTPEPEPEKGSAEPTPTPPPEEESPAPENENDPVSPPPDSENTPTMPPKDENEPTPPPEDDRNSPTPPATDPTGDSTGFPWWILAVLFASGAAAFRIAVTSPAFRSNRKKTEEGRMETWAQEVFDLLSSEHLNRKKGETVMGFTRRIDRLAYFSTAVSPVGECLSLIRYSRTEALETDTGMIRDTAILLRDEISRPARIRYWIRRLFLSSRHRSWTQ